MGESSPSGSYVVDEQALIRSNPQVLIVAFQLCEYVNAKGGSAMSADETRFLSILNVIVHGVLIPAIVCLSLSPGLKPLLPIIPWLLFIYLLQAIYPTVVIILVALNRTQLATRCTQYIESPSPSPTPRPVVQIETVTVSRRDGSSPDVLALRGEGGGRHKDASRRASEQRKVEPVV